MRLLLTALAYLCSLAFVLAVAIVLALFVVGPHADLLPDGLEPIVGAALWFTVIGLPLWIATRVWTRLDRTDATPPAPPSS